MYDINSLPRLIREGVAYGEANFPPIPAEPPDVVAADPGWNKQWLAVQDLLRRKTHADLSTWEPARKRLLGRYLGASGHIELSLIVGGCTYASSLYEMPAAWRTCIIKMAHQDMQHAASYMTRGSYMSGEDLWSGTEVKFEDLVASVQPILRRDLGGFFAVVGLHTEAYPAETNILEPFMYDEVLAKWFTNEIAEEAGHLDFLFPAIREYLNSGSAGEQEQKKRRMVADNEELMEIILAANQRNAERFLVGKLGLDKTVLQAFAHIPERTRYIYDRIGLERGYWPASLRQGVATDPTDASIADIDQS